MTDALFELPETTTKAYQVLARKYRPQDFESMRGQEVLVQTLRNAIKSGRIAHAFIMTGERGTGKTTTARIIARALNCLDGDGPQLNPCGKCDNCESIAKSSHVDVLEIDAASRTGVDDMREVLDSVAYRPVQARYKVYIIDEVHMLSKSAFNALLKTLEEPPEHVKFIFATTEINKVPITVLSRCQRFDLRRIMPEVLAEYFEEICGQEGIEFEPEAIAVIAKAADGSARDGLSLLDQAIAQSEGSLKLEQVNAMLGVADRRAVQAILQSLVVGHLPQALEQFDKLYAHGAQPVLVLKTMADLLHEATRALATKKPNDILGAEVPFAIAMRAWQTLTQGLESFSTAVPAKQVADMVLIKLAFVSDLPDPNELLTKLKSADPTALSTKPAQTAPAAMPVSSVAEPAVAAPQPLQVEAAPEPVPYIPPAPEFSPLPQSLEQLIALSFEKKEPRLANALKEDVVIQDLSPPKIALSLGPEAKKDLLGTLRINLKQWTGQDWQIDLIERPISAEPVMTLGQQERQAADTLMTKAQTSPEAIRIAEIFPGAKVTKVESAPRPGNETLH